MKHRAILLGVLLAILLPLHGQGDTSRVEGWDFVVLPSLSYNTDLGLHYGLYGNFYFYGRDTLCTYPEYQHMLGFEASRYTKGQSLLYLQYNGKEVLPRTDVTMTIRWQKDPTMHFWGYGDAFIYPVSNHLDEYFLLDRTYFLVNGGAETLITKRIKFYLGFAFWNFQMVNTDTSARHDGTLLSVMQNGNLAGGQLIHDDEANGGSILDLKVGALYDSRNHPTIPSRGCRIEAFVTRSIDLSHKRYNSFKLNARILQYYPIGNNVVFANRTALQLLLAGEQPYYTLSTINTMRTTNLSSEGLGGVTTLRGMPLNALTADGFAWANNEIRIKLFKFNALKRAIEVMINPFVDVGIPLKQYRIQDDIRLFVTAGMGGKLIVNQNFALSVEAGMLLGNPSDISLWGINFSTGFIF